MFVSLFLILECYSLFDIHIERNKDDDIYTATTSKELPKDVTHQHVTPKSKMNSDSSQSLQSSLGSSSLTEFFSSLKDMFSQITDKLSGIFDSLKDLFNDFLTVIPSLIDNLVSSVTSIFSAFTAFFG